MNNFPCIAGAEELCPEYLPLANGLNQVPLLRENRLRLYCHAPLRALRDEKGKAPPGVDAKAYADYLFCWDGTPLAAVYMNGEAVDVPGLPAVCPPRRGGNRYPIWETIAAVERALKQYTCPEEGARVVPELVHVPWRFTPRPVETETMARLDREGLIHAVTTRGQRAWLPTPWGADMGLVGGCDFPFFELVREHADVYCVPSALPELKRCLAWRERAGRELKREKREILPLKRRLQRVREGRPSEKAYSVALVRRLADMPLREYLRGFPDERKELYQAIPSLNRKDATYLDAAYACACLSMDRSERPPEYQGVFAQRDDILDILACPMVFERPTEPEENRPPKTLTVKPLAQRMAELRQSEDIFPDDMTLACLFEGAGQLSGSLMPEWLLERFADEYRNRHIGYWYEVCRCDEHASVMYVLSHAQMLRMDIGTDVQKKQESAEERYAMGTDLYNRLLIEPFQLIYQYRKEKSK